MKPRTNDQEQPQERSLAQALSALLAIGSGLLLAPTADARAVADQSGPGKQDPPNPLEVRVQKVREQLNEGQGQAPTLNPDNNAPEQIRTTWWGNWHNWHPGWGNWSPGWGNGGWHNRHHWHNWGNW